MSRAYKDGLADEADDLSSGALVAAGVEKLSGADLEQVRLAALNGSNPAVDAAGVKTLGTNAAFAKPSAQLTGADQERFMGTQ
jgi:hypothetical protein